MCLTALSRAWLTTNRDRARPGLCLLQEIYYLAQMLHMSFDLANAFFARDQIPLCFKAAEAPHGEREAVSRSKRALAFSIRRLRPSFSDFASAIAIDMDCSIELSLRASVVSSRAEERILNHISKLHPRVMRGCWSPGALGCCTPTGAGASPVVVRRPHCPNHPQ
jgi:hypothetical protein